MVVAYPSLAAAERLDEARRIAGQLLDLQHGFRVRRFCAGYAIQDTFRREMLAEHLLAAGLPE